jgi:hypothetical protein
MLLIVMQHQATSFEVIISLLYQIITLLYFIFFIVYHMKETGWEKIEEKDTNDYMYQYREDKTMNF